MLKRFQGDKSKRRFFMQFYNKFFHFFIEFHIASRLFRFKYLIICWIEKFLLIELFLETFFFFLKNFFEIFFYAPNSRTFLLTIVQNTSSWWRDVIDFLCIIWRLDFFIVERNKSSPSRSYRENVFILSENTKNIFLSLLLLRFFLVF